MTQIVIITYLITSAKRTMFATKFGGHLGHTHKNAMFIFDDSLEIVLFDVERCI